jgi:hypothetical protein
VIGGRRARRALTFDRGLTQASCMLSRRVNLTHKPSLTGAHCDSLYESTAGRRIQALILYGCPKSGSTQIFTTRYLKATTNLEPITSTKQNRN